MEVTNFKDLLDSLSETRKKFYATVLSETQPLEAVVNLFFHLIGLIRIVAKESDHERFSIEVLSTAFRRVIASIVLLESGLSQEAHMLLRNSLEFMLIGIDITYNSSSLEKWKQTINDDLDNNFPDEWYFKKSKICKRIEDNEHNLYPDLERKLVIGVTGSNRYGICQEWERISNKSLHAHSQAQLRDLFNRTGQFRLLALKKKDRYKTDFIEYSRFIWEIINVLYGIPKYRKLIGENTALTVQTNHFVDQYKKIMEKIGPPVATGL